MSKPLIGFFVILLILAACGDDSSDIQPTLTRPTPTTVPTTLSVWYSDSQMTEAYTTVLTEFEKRYPHITLHLTLQDPVTFPDTLNQSLAAGGEPDVIFASASLLDFLLARRNLLPLDSEQVAPLSVFVPAGAAEMGRRDEQMYGFPIQVFVPVLIYDASQDAPENYEAFFQSGHETIIRPNFLTTSLWLPIANTAAPRTADGQLNITPEGLAAYLQRLSDLNALPNVTFSDDLSNANAVYYLCSTADLPLLREKLGDRLRLAPPPDFVNLPQNRLFIGEAVLFMVTQNATEADDEAALTLLRFLLEQQEQISQISGYLPMVSREYDVQGAVFYSDSLFYEQIVPEMDALIHQNTGLD